MSCHKFISIISQCTQSTSSIDYSMWRAFPNILSPTEWIQIKCENRNNVNGTRNATNCCSNRDMSLVRIAAHGPRPIFHRLDCVQVVAGNIHVITLEFECNYYWLIRSDIDICETSSHLLRLLCHQIEKQQSISSQIRFWIFNQISSDHSWFTVWCRMK